MQNNQAKGMSGGKQGDALDLGDEYEDDEEDVDGEDGEVEGGIDQALQQQQEGQQEHQMYTHNQQPPQGIGPAAINAYN